MERVVEKKSRHTKTQQIAARKQKAQEKVEEAEEEKK